jgi:hypothetical protein
MIAVCQNVATGQTVQGWQLAANETRRRELGMCTPVATAQIVKLIMLADVGIKFWCAKPRRH